MDNKNKLITKNTTYLTIRMILLMAISFYTSRIVLDKLGVEDYGIYNVVSSFAISFAFFTSALTNATQRFLTIEYGRNEIGEANRVFNQHLIVYGIISIIVLVIAETFGIYYINNGLNINPERIYAAHWTYQFALAGIAIGLMCIPYEALFVAHEEMKIYSYVSVWEGLLKLVIVYLLCVSSNDNLILYSCLVFVVGCSCKIYYIYYSHRRFSECHLKWCYDKRIIYNTFKFVGWSFVSAGQISICDQGISIILNVYFGPVANAARGITSQISGIVFKFINNLLIAFQPQMVKSYATKEIGYLNELFYNSTRFSFYIMWLFVCPIIFCVDGLLSTWLVEVPKWTADMVKLNMLGSIAYVLTKPIWIIVVASGLLKKYTIATSITAFMTFPISCIALYFDCNAPVVYLSSLIVGVFNLLIQLKMLKSYLDYNTTYYLRSVIKPIGVVIMCSAIPSYCITFLNDGSTASTLLTTGFIFLITAVDILIFGLTKKEKILIFKKCRINKP